MSTQTQSSIDLQLINEKLKDCPDITGKKVYIDNKYEAFFLYVSNHIDRDLIQRDFIRSIVSMSLEQLSDPKVVHNLPCSNITLLYDTDEVITDVLTGSAVFISNSLGYGISFKDTNVDKRSIEEPETEKNLRGPHEGFIESLDTNMSILRRKIRNHTLKFKTVTLGEQSNQKVAIAYIEGLANNEIVQGLFEKISAIKTDSLQSIGSMEQSIETHPYSIFPEFLATERPDKAVAGLLEGRIIMLQDGTPVVLIAPVTFISFFQAMDDYSTLWLHGTFLRFIRIFGALVIAVFLPALYIVVTSFHYFAVPLTLLITLAETRSKVPFPPIVEVLILEITVELVREAAIRLPTYIATAISVVAGLVIGQAAVEAGIVSSLVIVIVAATAVASYVIPSSDMALAIRILRFTFMIASAVFGVMGIIVCTALTLANLISMDSLGQPYFAPFSPYSSSEMKDTFVRLQIKKLIKRPVTTKPEDSLRGSGDGRK